MIVVPWTKIRIFDPPPPDFRDLGICEKNTKEYVERNMKEYVGHMKEYVAWQEGICGKYERNMEEGEAPRKARCKPLLEARCELALF